MKSSTGCEARTSSTAARRRRLACAAAAVSIGVLSSARGATNFATWAFPQSGSWSGWGWSSYPYMPNNGTPDGSTWSATVKNDPNATGTLYIDADISLESLNITATQGAVL